MMRIKPWEHSQACLGRKVILTRTGAKSIHISLTERACKSPTLFNDVSANKRVTLRVRIRSGADSKGSNGAPIRPSRMTDKSQEGTPMGRTDLRRRIPHIKAETIRCLPRESHPERKWSYMVWLEGGGGTSMKALEMARGKRLACP